MKKKMKGWINEWINECKNQRKDELNKYELKREESKWMKHE